MFRTDDPTRSTDENGTGKDGYSETLSQPTRLRADALNSIQEELANPVESFGLALDKTDQFQLLKVLRGQGMKAALAGLREADDTAAAQTLRGIARKARALSNPAIIAVVGDAGTIYKSTGGEFTAVTVGSSYADDFKDVVYDATLDLFLMCGENGEIQSWPGSGAATRRSTGGTDHLLAIASNGLNKNVAVGQNGLIKYTSNGTAWSTGTDPFSGADLCDVAFGAGLFVAISGTTGPGIATSPTGQSWTQRLAPSGIDNGTDNQVVYHSTLGFLAYSQTSPGTVYHSPDGITWTSILSNAGTTGSKLFAGPYCWGVARAISNGSSARCHLSTAVSAEPYFDYDFIADQGFNRVIVLDNQLWALYDDRVFAGGAL